MRSQIDRKLYRVCRKAQARGVLFLHVAIGCALGSMVRWWVVGFFDQRLKTWFPVGTLLVNVTGCFALGIILGLDVVSFPLQIFDIDIRVLLSVGFLGGLTTFSSVALQIYTLISRQQWSRAASYMIASVSLSMICLMLGQQMVGEIEDIESFAEVSQ